MNIGIHVKTYRICNPIVEFLKYEFNNKLLGDVTLFRGVQVTLGIILKSVTLANNLEIPPLNYMFYMFSVIMPIFMSIGCYLLFDL